MNWSDAQRKNVANNVDRSSLRALYQMTFDLCTNRRSFFWMFYLGSDGFVFKKCPGLIFLAGARDVVWYHCNPNSSWEGEVGFLHGSRPANGVYFQSALSATLYNIIFIQIYINIYVSFDLLESNIECLND